MKLVEGALLALRFALELAALAALAWWGLSVDWGVAAQVVLGVGAPLAAATLWGTFVAPRARARVSGAMRLGVEWAVFGGAALALWAVGRPVLGLVFFLVAAADGLLVRALARGAPH